MLKERSIHRWYQAVTYSLHPDLPDDVYIRLSEAAQHQGITVEAYATELLKEVVRAWKAEQHDTDKDEAALNRANDVGARAYQDAPALTGR